MIFLCTIFLRPPRHFEWCELELPFQDCTTLPFCLLLIVGVDWAIFVIATTRSKIVAKIFMVWLLVSCTICIVVVINDDWVLTNGTTRIFCNLPPQHFCNGGRFIWQSFLWLITVLGEQCWVYFTNTRTASVMHEQGVAIVWNI